MMTRSGRMKSSIAAPSLRNSGLLATVIRNGLPRLSRPALISSATRSPVPTGTVDLSTTMQAWLRRSANAAATAKTCDKSAEPSSPHGVPTAIKIISA
ncbi:hypothetical protein D9M68_826710 [compost metagenome]